MKVAKLKEKKKIPAKSFDEKKNVKLGYVAAEANDDAHADINAYYLGVKAVCKKGCFTGRIYTHAEQQ